MTDNELIRLTVQETINQAIERGIPVGRFPIRKVVPNLDKILSPIEKAIKAASLPGAEKAVQPAAQQVAETAAKTIGKKAARSVRKRLVQKTLFPSLQAPSAAAGAKAVSSSRRKAAKKAAQAASKRRKAPLVPEKVLREKKRLAPLRQRLARRLREQRGIRMFQEKLLKSQEAALKGLDKQLEAEAAKVGEKEAANKALQEELNKARSALRHKQSLLEGVQGELESVKTHRNLALGGLGLIGTLGLGSLLFGD